MTHLTQQQVEEASRLCDRILEIAARLQADFAALKAASGQFAADLETSQRQQNGDRQ